MASFFVCSFYASMIPLDFPFLESLYGSQPWRSAQPCRCHHFLVLYCLVLLPCLFGWMDIAHLIRWYLRKRSLGFYREDIFYRTSWWRWTTVETNGQIRQHICGRSLLELLWYGTVWTDLDAVYLITMYARIYREKKRGILQLRCLLLLLSFASYLLPENY
jgi:hypothetical protein